MSVFFVLFDVICCLFVQVMFCMYCIEVLLYGMLVELVEWINVQVFVQDLVLVVQLQCNDECVCLDEECYGVICVGIVQELVMLCCLFVVMGMYLVGYYDLLVVGVLVYFIVFCLLIGVVLVQNLFCVFILLLCLELIEDEVLCVELVKILVCCCIFIDGVLVLIDQVEWDGGLLQVDVECFVDEVLEIFCWYGDVMVDLLIYCVLYNVYWLVVDVVSFRGLYINYLILCMLDIDVVQVVMIEYGMVVKVVIEGLLCCVCLILLCQISFKVLEEVVYFLDVDGGDVGIYIVCFGEIE